MAAVGEGGHAVGLLLAGGALGLAALIRHVLQAGAPGPSVSSTA